MFIVEEHADLLSFSGMLIIHYKMHDIKNSKFSDTGKYVTHILITCNFSSYSLSVIFVIEARTKKSGNIQHHFYS
jgi:hypothetical protein